jgi:uncharacterized protein YjbI with pentapeptide repeats
MSALFYNETFRAQTQLLRGEYENCTFIGQNFSSLNFGGFIFVDCAFVECDLSNASIKGTAFRTVTFDACKMLGLQFENSNDFGFSITCNKCILNHTSFFQRKLKKVRYTDCELLEVDFSESDLSEAVFANCNLMTATFTNSNLFKSDFRSAFNYNIDPEKNNIKKAKFRYPEVIGLLSKYDIQIEQ